MHLQKNLPFSPARVNPETFYKMLAGGEFAAMVRESVRGRMIQNSKETYNILKPLAAEMDDREALWCIFLDAKNRTLGLEKMFEGTITASAVYPREIIKAALTKKAVAIIIAHNHPSGDPAPSSEDLAITFRLQVACSSMNITLHEHLIVGDDSYHSFADTGRIADNHRKIEGIL